MTRFVQQFHGKIYFLPLALLTADAVLSCYELATGLLVNSRFPIFSLAITAGWISIVTGVLALFWVRKNRLAAGLFFIHGFINTIALLVLSAFWTHEMKTYPTLKPSILPVAILKCLMIAILATGTYLGKKQPQT